MSSEQFASPEHNARLTSEEPHPEVVAADCYVDKVIRYSRMIGNYPFWPFWSMREAFLAGCSHVHSQRPGLDADLEYCFEVRDMEDQFQAGGHSSDLAKAMATGNSYAHQYTPCKLRVWTEKTIHEATFDD